MELGMIIRNHYMAQLKDEFLQDGDGNKKVEETAEVCKDSAKRLIDEGKLLTVALYHYRNMLFLYYEEVCDEADKPTDSEAEACGISVCRNLEKHAVDENDRCIQEITPDIFMRSFDGLLEKWPKDGSMVNWIKMFHIYYHNKPKSVEQWQQDRHPQYRRGRIAKLREDKLFEYVYHHVAIVNEGLLTGDKYQSIALYGDMLFSYFEEPKKFVNIKEDYEHESQAISEWLAIDPESHFIPFPEAGGSNFYIIPEYFAIGRENI